MNIETVNEIEQLAEQHGMTVEFVTWFFNEQKAGCGNVWFMMMAAMWEGWKGRSIEMDKLAAENVAIREQSEEVYAAGYNHGHLNTVDGIAYADCVKDDFYGLALQIMAEAETPATDRIYAGIKADGRVEGAHFVANRMLAAWDAGFIEDTAKNAADIAHMILTSAEFMADAPEGDFDRSFADGILEDIAKQLREKDRAKALAKQNAERTKAEKEGRQRRRAKRIELKTKSQWRSEAQTAFNKYVRLRDAGKPCISCGRLPEQKLGGTMDCGHYRTRGAARHLSFNLHNTAAQCVYCNRDRAGAQKAFEQGLIERIGPAAVDALNNDNTIRNFDIPYLKRIKSIFTRKSRALEKSRASRQEAA